MPTQEYRCDEHGGFDIITSFADPVARSVNCPECGASSAHVLRAPAGIVIKNTWNDDANEMRRDPYTQARYQAEHSNAEARELGIVPPKITEESLQLGAATIDAENKAPPKPSDTVRAVRATRAALRDKINTDN